jgi:hypothetical protein
MAMATKITIISSELIPAASPVSFVDASLETDGCMRGELDRR